MPDRFNAGNGTIKIYFKLFYDLPLVVTWRYVLYFSMARLSTAVSDAQKYSAAPGHLYYPQFVIASAFYSLSQRQSERVHLNICFLYQLFFMLRGCEKI